MRHAAFPGGGGVIAVPLSGGVLAQALPPKPSATKWVVPRTPDGKPDLQGNWSIETQTPLERQGNGPLILTDAEAQAIETRAQLVEEYRDKASDPNRPPRPKAAIRRRWSRRASRLSSSRSPRAPPAASAATTGSGLCPAPR